MPALEERVAQLEQQVALFTEFAHRLLEGRYEGADGAAAIVLAIEGGQGTIQVKDPFARGAAAPPDQPAPLVWTPIDVRGKLATNDEASYRTRSLANVRGVDIHYTAGPSTQTVQQVAAYQTSEGARGQTGTGTPFPGLAYTLFVEGSGAVYLAHDLNVRVWHNEGQDHNGSHVGICYAGNSRPNAAQIDGIGRAIGWLERQLGRRMEIGGHKDVSATSCPGPYWPTWLPDVKAAIR